MLFFARINLTTPLNIPLELIEQRAPHLMGRTFTLRPYEKKVLVSIGSNTFFALKYWKFAKKVLDPILDNTFFSYGRLIEKN